jgi:hypothetical protein
LPLLRKVIEVRHVLVWMLSSGHHHLIGTPPTVRSTQDLENAKASDESHASFYFTKEVCMARNASFLYRSLLTAP